MNLFFLLLLLNTEYMELVLVQSTTPSSQYTNGKKLKQWVEQTEQHLYLRFTIRCDLAEQEQEKFKQQSTEPEM